MDRRCENVVFPEDDGPAIMTKRTSFRAAIYAAMSPIFFSIIASLDRMSCMVLPCETAAFNSATLDAFSASESLAESERARKSFREGRNSPNWPGALRAGRRSTKLFSNSSSPKHLM